MDCVKITDEMYTSLVETLKGLIAIAPCELCEVTPFSIDLDDKSDVCVTGVIRCDAEWVERGDGYESPVDYHIVRGVVSIENLTLRYYGDDKLKLPDGRTVRQLARRIERELTEYLMNDYI